MTTSPRRGRIVHPAVLRRFALALGFVLGPAVAHAQNIVACDFDIDPNRGENTYGGTIHLTGRSGASSDRGTFFIVNGNSPASDVKGDGYSTTCDFHHLFVSLKLPLINEANPSLAIPAENIVVTNLNPVLLNGEAEEVYVQVEVPAGTQAGTYRGSLTIRDDSITAVPNAESEILNLDGIDVEVQVLPNYDFGLVNADSAKALDSLVVPARAGQRVNSVFRIANTSNTPLTDVRISASDLQSESAVGLTIPAKNITFNAPSFATIMVGDTVRTTVTIDVPRGLLSGRYRGTLFVQANGAPATEIPLIVVVTSSRGILFENNPVRTINGGVARFAFNGDPGTTYKVAIFDMAGLTVYTTQGTVFAGVSPGSTTGAGCVPPPGTTTCAAPGADYAASVSWPLLNGRGQNVASGMYLVVVESIVNGKRQLAQDKLMVIR